MILEPVSDLIKHALMYLCWRGGHGGTSMWHPICLSHHYRLECGPVRSVREGFLGQAELLGPDALEPQSQSWHCLRLPRPLGGLAPSTGDTLGNQSQPGFKSHSAPPLCK